MRKNQLDWRIDKIKAALKGDYSEEQKARMEFALRTHEALLKKIKGDSETPA